MAYWQWRYTVLVMTFWLSVTATMPATAQTQDLASLHTGLSNIVQGPGSNSKSWASIAVSTKRSGHWGARSSVTPSTRRSMMHWYSSSSRLWIGFASKPIIRHYCNNLVSRHEKRFNAQNKGRAMDTLGAIGSPCSSGAESDALPRTVITYDASWCRRHHLRGRFPSRSDGCARHRPLANPSPPAHRYAP